MLGPIAAIFFAPSLFRDRVRVSADRFEVRTGIWGLTAVHDINFNDITQIRLIAETATTNRSGTRTNYFLLCEKRTGEASKVPVNNAVAEKGGEAIVRAAVARGIPIKDDTGGK